MTIYQKKLSDLEKDLETNFIKGLTKKKAQIYLKEHGENKLIEKKGKTTISMIFEELANFLNVLLIIAAITSIIVSNHLTDGIFIIVIVILNVVLSVVQQKKAMKTIKSLKNISSQTATVIRNSKEELINADNLVVGDIVLIEQGNNIPADLRLIETINLKTNESALTGESTLVIKDASNKIETEKTIGDRNNMAYMGTSVASGRAKGVVVRVGMQTEIGKIATLLNEVKEDSTPLQKKVNKLGKTLGSVSVIICFIIILLGIKQNMPLDEVFLIGVSLAVAAIPEGLGAVITIVLAIGMRKMALKKALVKELNAVETLGQTTVICTDKTGTLTQNKMVVKKIYDNSKIIEVTGDDYTNKGKIKKESKNLDKLLEVSVLCNDSIINENSYIGDPTELALVALASKKNIVQKEYKEKFKRIDEFEFDSTRKIMSTKNLVNKKYYIYTKGAMDEILKKSTHYLKDGEKEKIDESFLEKINTVNKNLAKEAMRVIGFAYKETSKEKNIKEDENGLIFVGLTGIIDPPREEVKEVIKICRKANIRVIMITGDHIETAIAIGKDLGILSKENEAMLGSDIDKLDDLSLKEKLKKVTVFARVAPVHKVKIVKLLQEIGEITTMTGDGVNDAPALKQANIGVAMGITGSDVSKESANMVLMNDNFVTIVDAIKEGRVIYNNIRKFVAFLVSCNVGEILLITIAMILNLGSPLLAVQILWINLITDTFPAFSLGLEKNDEDVMLQKPIDSKENIINKNMLKSIIIQSIALAFAVLLSFYIGSIINDINIKNMAQEEYYILTTYAFITVIVGELLRAYSARSEKKSIFKMNIEGNKYMNYSILVGLILLIIVVYIPQLNSIFHTVRLPLNQFLIAFSLGLIPLLGGEISKKIKR